ncbi:MAG: mechanosensitive ion channel domain-containing protein [Gammaproteobacteria bacterium]
MPHEHASARKRDILAICWLMFLGWVLAAPPVFGAPRPQGVTLEGVQAKVKQIHAKKGLPDDSKTRLLNLYQLAQHQLETAQEFETRAASYQQAIASAPGETRRLRALLAQAPAERPPEADLDTAPIPELERQSVAEETRLSSIKNELTDLDQQLQGQRDRPVKAREELTAAQRDLQGVEQDLKRTPGSRVSASLAEAERIARQAQRQARMSELTMLEQELLSYDVRIALLQAQRELLARELPLVEGRLGALRDAIAARQKAEAEEAKTEAERAEREALGKHPTLRRVIEKDAALSTELAATLDHLGETQAARKAVEAQAKQIERDFKGARKKIEIAGLSQALGQVLREQRRKLPDTRRYLRDTRDRQAEIARVGLRVLQLEEQRSAAMDVPTRVGRLMDAQVDSSIPPGERGRIKAELQKLLNDRQGMYGRLVEAYTSYLRALGELDFAERRLIDGAQGYAAFLDQRLLWIPSARPLGVKAGRDLWSATLWLFSPTHWLQALQSFTGPGVRGVSNLVFASLSLLVLALLGMQRRWQAKIEAISAQVANPHSDRFLLTLQALSLTALTAAPLPLFLATLGWRLQGIYGAAASAFPRAVGDGLIHIALPLFFFIAFYRLCRPDGVAEDHFRWRESALTVLRRHLRWLIPVALPALFVTAVVGWEAQEVHRDSLGRLAFIVSMMAFTVFAQRILSPKGGVFAEELRRHPNRWLARLRYLWYPLGAGIPLILAGLAAVGYYYTARQLEGQLAATVWLVIGGVITHDLVIRWLTLEQRKLAIAQAKEKREAARAAQAAQAAAQASGAEAPIDLEITVVDLPTITEQTRQLTRIVITLSVVLGLWFIWVQVLPALAILDHVTLWQYTVVVDGQEQQQAVTLANLLLALLVGVVTVAAARNLPGVLEIALLRRLSIDAGSRYAITQVLRYVIVTAGISGVFNAFGGTWSQVQWVVAGLGVGLGFGLQEIFANFISGLIILLERPIRVGDTVTIRDTSGTVSRIRMRTTTLIDGDRRALIVPNKTFITEQLVNWSLDPMTLVVRTIGVATGADLALAQELILNTAKSLPQVLKDPEPTVYFMGVSESMLSFELRVFVKDLEHRMPLMHALDIALHEAFREHDLRIRIPAAA